MKWTYHIRQKTKAALLLALVLVLVLGKNFLDSNNVSRLGNSFAAVYEDRLLVESYIFQLSGQLYQKKMMLDNCASTDDYALLKGKITDHNATINQLLADYGKTKLTPAEAQYFADFKQNLEAIRRLENSYLMGPSGVTAAVASKAQMDQSYMAAAGYLNQLSNIQVEEGKRLSDQSKKIIAGSTILTQFELVLVIAIGVMIQMLVFASKSKLPKFKQNPMLN